MACELIKEKPLSSACHSLQERGTLDCFNSTTEYRHLNLISARSLVTLNFDLDFAVKLSKEIQQQNNSNLGTIIKVTNNVIECVDIQVSGSDFYYISILIRLIQSSKNFHEGTPFEVSIRELAILLFGKNTQSYSKRIKKYLTILSSVAIKGTYFLSYTKRNGKSPLIIFNKLDLSEKNDFVMIPRDISTNILTNLIKKPKAFCLFLEQFYLAQKNFLEETTEGWCANRQKKSDARLESIFCSKHTHNSLREIKSTGYKYLQAALNKEDVYQEISSIAISCITEKQVNKFKNLKQERMYTNSMKFANSSNRQN